MDIYKIALTKAKGGSPIISEGCEGEITKDFAPVFNGWSMNSLIEKSNGEDYEKILAPVPMKVEAILKDEVIVDCGDDQKLIDENNLAMSDLRGFAGFYERLKGAVNRPDLFNSYRQSLERGLGDSIEFPIEYSRDKALEALDRAKKLIEKRNYFFVKAVEKYSGENPVIIIGGIHAEHLSKLLEAKGYEVDIITPEGYGEGDTVLFDTLEKSLLKDKGAGIKIVWHQTPYGFNEKSIPLGNLMAEDSIATKEEWEKLKSIMRRAKLSPDILRLDYDKDGIRDFTLSSNGSLLVISAEDDDWDNDGEPNLSDKSWGDKKFKISEVRATDVGNRFNISSLKADNLLKEISKHNVKLLGKDGMKFDLIHLKAISEVLKKVRLKKNQLRYFRLATPDVKYGKEVYFSYNPSSLSVDIYLNELNTHYKSIKTSRFRKETDEKVLKGYFMPLLGHSIAHEVAHAMEEEMRKVASSDGWEFNVIKTNGKYLTSSRLERKKITETLVDFTFRGKDSKTWNPKYEIIKLNNGESVKSFLVREGIPSAYSLKMPKEWFAEKLAMCFIRIAYPDSKTKDKAWQYEALLGINPASVNDSFCSKYYHQ